MLAVQEILEGAEAILLFEVSRQFVNLVTGGWPDGNTHTHTALGGKRYKGDACGKIGSHSVIVLSVPILPCI